MTLANFAEGNVIAMSILPQHVALNVGCEDDNMQEPSVDAAPLLEYYGDGGTQRKDYCGAVVMWGRNAATKIRRSSVVEGPCWLWRAVRDVVMKDTTKTIHSLKMGLALVLAFLLVLVQPSYVQLGNHAIWAIMTVIIVFELTIGATVSKGLNRGVATLLAGMLAVVVGELAEMTSGSGFGHPILVGCIVFLVASVVTFAKQWPSLKPYEFGIRAFLITFSMITVAEYRGGDPVGTAINRFWIIILGAAIGVSVNVFLLPCWAGNELHSAIASNFCSVADSLELCVDDYLHGTILERFAATDDDPVYKKYRPILMSAAKEESLAGFARWEPPHGRFKTVKYPWHLYVKVGAVLRHCTYSMAALHGCLQSGMQAPVKARKLFEKEIRALGVECALVLRKLGKQMESMQKGQDISALMKGVEHAVHELQRSLHSHSYLLVHDDVQHVAQEWPNFHAKSLFPRPVLAPHQHIENAAKSFLPHDSQTLSQYSTFFHPYTPLISHDITYPQFAFQPPHHHNIKRTHSLPTTSLTHQFHFAENPHLAHRVGVSQSASALSVGTFASLLMEVALRLGYVIATVQELSEHAHFSNFEEENKREWRIQINGHV